MRVMVFVKASPNSEKGVMPSEELFREMGEFNEQLAKAGILLAGAGLKPSSAGARVHFSGKQRTVTDGPFAETKELVAGFAMIEVKSLADAIGWAKRIPFQEGVVEIRPLFELSDFPVDPAEHAEGWREKEEQMRAAPPARKPGTQRYLGLLKADPDTEAGKMPDEKMLAAMGAFLEEGTKAGIFLAGEGLKPSSKSARVQYSGNQRTVVDGPFAETKELVAGYALLQFATKAEALEWTKRFVQVDAPGRYRGQAECELRPIFELEQFGHEFTEQFVKASAG